MISAIKFLFKSPRINLLSKCIKGVNKTGVLWSKYLLILLLQLHSLVNSSQDFYYFIFYAQSTSPQFEESAIILVVFLVLFCWGFLSNLWWWSFIDHINREKSSMHLKVTIHPVVIIRQAWIVPPAYWTSVAVLILWLYSIIVML